MISLIFRHGPVQREVILRGKAGIIYNEIITGPDGSAVATFEDGFWRLNVQDGDDLYQTVEIAAVSAETAAVLDGGGER